MARLIVESGGERREFEVAAETVLGRFRTCAVVLEEKTISREHARIVREGDRYVLHDLGSRSGTLVNGRRISAPTILAHGDAIRVGPFVLRFVVPELATSAGSTEAILPRGARARLRTPEEVAAAQPPSSALSFLLYVSLLVVFAGVAFGSRLGFGWFLDRVLS